MAEDGFVRVDGLTRHFALGAGGLLGGRPQIVRAVDDVSFSIRRGETLAVVGESGCGKTTVGRLVLRLIEADAGRIEIGGTDIRALDDAALRRFRRRIQIVIQDPFGSLNPRMTIGAIILEPLEVHREGNAASRRARLAALLEMVGLPAEFAARFPHELSGGQRQRVGIARALALETDLLVCDEAVSALDVSVQAQIVNLLQRIKREQGLTYLFISHDMAIVRHMADRIAVMYLGQIVETGPKRAIFDAPAHPYTRALLASVPRSEPGTRPAPAVLGDIPSPIDPPPGCRFHTRCPHAGDICRTVRPAPVALAAAHTASCHLLDPATAAQLRSPS
ncbi:ATP-binding cassette domain-containing protein [Rhodobacteraceae bacterium 2CG4]|uniref:ATP-binding cassette domain-containing protein n=1 Tax=Halovulum marinum TaxID=2662447 RepID=A0A6L5Z2G3_9RHOB|nr:ABC transporter ATP-binding protein [Halovulum marinum]MSU90763.1 ATP-binding cassette domain-containing protein [Halovulum marinum]